MQTMTISISFRNHKWRILLLKKKKKTKKQVESPQIMMMTSVTPTQSNPRSMILFYFILCVWGYKLIDWRQFLSSLISI